MTIAPELQPLIISVSVFFAVFLLFWGIFQFIRYRRFKRDVIIKIQQSREKTEIFEKDSLSLQTGYGFSNKALSFLGLVGKRFGRKKTGDYSSMRIKFLKGGIRWKNAPAVFWGIKVFLLIIFPLSFVLIHAVFAGLLSPANFLILLFLIALISFYLPDIWFHSRISRRKNQIIKGLPDALDLLVVCVEAGMGLDSSINRVAKEMKSQYKALSDEFNFYILELQAGKSRRDALKNMALRIDLGSVKNFVMLLIQSDKLGTGIAHTLRVYSDTFRQERYWKAEELAGKLGVKLIIPLILLIFPSLFVVIMGPAIIRIYQIIIQP